MVLFTFINVKTYPKFLISTLKICRCLENTVPLLGDEPEGLGQWETLWERLWHHVLCVSVSHTSCRHDIALRHNWIWHYRSWHSDSTLKITFVILLQRRAWQSHVLQDCGGVLRHIVSVHSWPQRTLLGGHLNISSSSSAIVHSTKWDKLTPTMVPTWVSPKSQNMYLFHNVAILCIV